MDRVMIEDPHVTLAHGNGGRRMRELIERIFAHHLANPSLDIKLDAAPLNFTPGMVPCITTDAFTVRPLEFPGGDIGSLAVNGTVNDLAVSGAEPRFLTLNAIIEEGLEVECLDRIVRSLAQAARAAGVQVVAGDTKVVPRGQGGGLYFATTGVGLRAPDLRLGLNRISAGDMLLISGPAGDHGIAVMLAREEFELSGSVQSDCAAVTPLTAPLAAMEGLRFMRDPTRGGVATVAHEIAAATHFNVRLAEAQLPVRDSVRSFCHMLGYDPYYLACEGRVVAVAAPDAAEDILKIWRAIPGGEQASAIGVVCGGKAQVILETEIGGERFLEELEDDPLPRIC
jgi:hydrogenase expression/formation protein HypE